MPKFTNHHFIQLQYDGINIADYLKVEGGSYVYRLFAAKSKPHLTFVKENEAGLYTQLFEVAKFPQEYALDFYKQYFHKDGIGTDCRSTAQIVDGNFKEHTVITEIFRQDCNPNLGRQKRTRRDHVQPETAQRFMDHAKHD